MDAGQEHHVPLLWPLVTLYFIPFYYFNNHIYKFYLPILTLFFSSLGGTIIGPTFNGYAPFPNPAAVLPPRGHPAFFPQQIIYWPYPSPPVSPTAYYGPAHPPPHPHIAPNFTPPLHQPTLVSILFIINMIYYCINRTIFFPSQVPIDSYF